MINSFSSKLKSPSRIRSLCSRYLKLSGPAKLSTPEKIENTLVTCPGVGEIWAYGDGTRNFLVGVVVPDPIAVLNSL